MSGGSSNEAMPCCASGSANAICGQTNIKSKSNAREIGSTMDRILRVAGIDSAPMDPSSAKYLKELISVEMEKEHSESESPEAAVLACVGKHKHDNDYEVVSSSSTTAAATPAAATATTGDIPEKMGTKIQLSSKPSLASRMRSPPVLEDLVTGNAVATTSSPAGKSALSSAPTPNLHLDAASKKLASRPLLRPITTAQDEERPVIDIEEDSPPVSRIALAASSLCDQLVTQKKAMEDQSEVLTHLTSHIKELTETVRSLQESVDDLQIQRQMQFPKNAHAHTESSTSTSTPSWGGHDHPSANLTKGGDLSVVASNSAEDTNNDSNEGDPSNNRAQNPNENEFQRAHLLAHQVAWRIATFPARALVFYLKYEYRIWVVFYRLARRDVLNPFREAGMIFQLGFALVIVYGRIAPALEHAVNQRRKERDGQYDDDDEYDGNGGDNNNDDDDDFLTDAEFQIETLVFAIVAGFLYHVGWFGLLYRFFFRDRLPVKILQDLRDGVAMTPTYGLEFDQEPATGENHENQVEENNNNPHGAAGGDNNNIPQPPNRNPANNGNNNNNDGNGNGPVVDLANAIGNGVNDFFMGHRRRRQEAEAEDGGERALRQELRNNNTDANNVNANDINDDVYVNVNDIDNRRNPIIGLISDILCLFYSFLVSILPGWNYEQQLRDIRDGDDRRLRAQMEREAEVLRNPPNDNNENENEYASSESESDSDLSESESESEVGDDR